MLADQVLEIADSTKKGVVKITKETERGTFTETRIEEAIRHRELQVDARKWLLAKLRPGQYGDKLDVSTSFTFNVPNLIAGGVTGKALKPGERVDKLLPATAEAHTLPEWGAIDS